MTRDRESFLFDIHDSARFLLGFTRNESLTRYKKDRAFRRAVERELQIIGEAMFQLSRLDAALAEKIGESERIIGFRHVLVHGYFDLKADIVWNVIKTKLSSLVADVAKLLTDAGFPPNEKEDEQ